MIGSKTAMRRFLKLVWRRLPPGVRVWYFRALFARWPERTGNTPDAGAPFYVCGPFLCNSGIGRGARLYADRLEEAGHDVTRVDMTEAMRMPKDFAGAYAQPASLRGKRGGTVVLHANPPQFQLALLELQRQFLESAHVRAYWAWETPWLPPEWLHALAYVDSIETPSDFCAEILRRHTAKPVAIRAHMGEIKTATQKIFAPEGILRCLVIFDAGSSFRRKNPQAALAAFREAFGPGEATLTFKIAHPEADRSAFLNFGKLCAQTPGVHIITDTLADAEMAALYDGHDVCISLHRGEGYGLTLREGQAHGLHVVATGWSGNMDFMTGPLAHPVPFSLVRNGRGEVWAEADSHACAHILREIYNNLAQARA